jgi:pyruvate dehydrogenase E1 component alpha subunit
VTSSTASTAQSDLGQLSATGQLSTEGDVRDGDTVRIPLRGPALQPEMVQLLTPAGDRVAHPNYRSTLDDATIAAAYRDLVITRRFDQEATALQRQGQLGLWAPLLGQEAAQLGAGYALRAGDYVFPTYREHGLALARQVDPLAILRLFRGVDHGTWDTTAHGFGLYTIVIGAQTPQAVGYAMGISRDGTDEAVLCCLGDGAASEGVVSEAFNFAAVFDAPVVFFMQNNQWAISAPNTRQTAVPLHQRADGFGFPGVRVDGNDLLAVQAVTAAALDHARTGGGPVLVEAYTFRMGAHTTSDDPSRYRLAEEEASWRERDPLQRVERYLRRHTDTPADFFDQVDVDAAALAARVRRDCLALPDPQITDLYQHVFAELPADLAAERAQMADYLASFDDAR